MPRTIITFSSIAEKMALLHARPHRHETWRASLSMCPTCGHTIRQTCFYKRTIQFLAEDVTYHIGYYYCRHCKHSLTSPPPGTLPNLQIGLDVLCHIGKLHCIHQHSLADIKRHLFECHGISRAIGALHADIGRLGIFTDNSTQWFLPFLQAYYQTARPKHVMLDECFLHSFYRKKLALSVLLLPEFNFLFASKITRTVTNQVTQELLAEVKRISPCWDLVSTDLARRYSTCVKEVLKETSLQFCVFHFFRLVYREVVLPSLGSCQQIFQNQREKLVNQLKKPEKLPGGQFLEGNALVIAQRLTSRVSWCLSQKQPKRCVQELQALLQNTKNKIQGTVSGIESRRAHALREIAAWCVSAGTAWLRRVQARQEVKGYFKLQEMVQRVILLFQDSNKETLKENLQKLVVECESDPAPSVKRLADYIQKYLQNLILYLRWGVHKATSLLEKCFQEFRPNWRNGKGAKTVEGYTAVLNISTLLKNTVAFRRRGENQTEAQSPVQRLFAVLSPSPAFQAVNSHQAWYEWIPDQSVQSYKQKWKQAQIRRKKEWRLIKRLRQARQESNTPYAADIAQQRWHQSETLQLLDQYLNPSVYETEIPGSPSKERLGELSSKDAQIYGLLRQHPGGLTRPELVRLTQLPRSTLYDVLVRLESQNLVTRQRERQNRVGRSKTLFLPCLIDPG